ncbi:MAG: glycosyltransferase [Candidatus Omnitrophica bacterium]|nr:glycosyltransferase [Candidatus Omnitrophota bacterium]
MDKSQRKINIVLLTDCLGDITGGAEKQIFEMARRLPKDQYNVFIASQEAQGETSAKLIQSINCQLHIFRVVRIYGLSGLIQGLRFFSFLRCNSIDVLMTYHFGSDIWGTFWGHLAGVRYIISNRRDMAFWRKRTQVTSYRILAPWVNKIVTVASVIKQMIIETENISPDKIEVIYNGVELPKTSVDFTEVKKQLGFGLQDTVIMHVANLRPIKGHKYLIEAFAKIAPHFPNAKLVLIGKDELNGKLQDLVQRLGISPQTLFLGQRNDVSNLLAIADICVLPSLSEGMSNAILEYMAFGKPVIATNVGGNPELIVHEVNGLLVEKENIEQLAEALNELLTNEEKRHIFAANGVALIKEKFSMDAMIDRYSKLINKYTPIKVLHLVSSGGLYGAEQVMLTLAGCKDGVIHVIGALNNQHNPNLEIIEDAEKRNLNTAVFESRGRIDFNTVKQVSDFVLKNNINIIHTHNYKANLIGALAAHNSGKKWVATLHGWTKTDHKLRWYENIDAFILKYADKTICVSDINFQDLLSRRFSPSRLALIFNGIDLDRFPKTAGIPQLKSALNIPNNNTIIAIVGRLSPEKGHEVLFNAFGQVIEHHPDVKLLVVGDGPLRNKLEDKIKNLNLSRSVFFTGVRKDMADIYGICDILVNASYTEGLPMTILEAMASKVAVIATRVGAVDQVIQNGKNGLLIAPDDHHALIDALSQLIQDPQKRQHLIQEAHNTVRNSFSNKIMFDNYKKIYKEVLDTQ